MDSFRTIFKEKFTFTLKTHRTAFVITVKFPNLLKRYFSKLLLPTTACQINYLKQMFVEINFCEINFCGIRGLLQFRKNFSAQIFFLIFLSAENKSLILLLKIFSYEFSWYTFDDFAKICFSLLFLYYT